MIQVDFINLRTILSSRSSFCVKNYLSTNKCLATVQLYIKKEIERETNSSILSNTISDHILSVV